MRDCGQTVTMFSRGEPTFSLLFKRGQITSSSFSPQSYLLHPRSRHEHNPQVDLPSALQSRFAFSYISKANSGVKTKIKTQKEKKGNTRGSCPTNPNVPHMWYHPLYCPYFLHYIKGHTSKRSLHRLLIARSQIVSYSPSSHQSSLLCSFLTPQNICRIHKNKSYTQNHTYKEIIRAKSYAQIIWTNIDELNIFFHKQSYLLISGGRFWQALWGTP